MGTFRSFTGFHYEIPDDDVHPMVEKLKHIRRTARKNNNVIIHFQLFVLNNVVFFKSLSGEERAHFCEECGYGGGMTNEIAKMIALSGYVTVNGDLSHAHM